MQAINGSSLLNCTFYIQFGTNLKLAISSGDPYAKFCSIVMLRFIIPNSKTFSYEVSHLLSLSICDYYYLF